MELEKGRPVSPGSGGGAWGREVMGYVSRFSQTVCWREMPQLVEPGSHLAWSERTIAKKGTRRAIEAFGQYPVSPTEGSLGRMFYPPWLPLARK